MKKTLAALLGCLLLFALGACGGRVGGARFVEVPSQIYSQEDIRAAADVVRAEFARAWRGCTLKEISYAGDERCAVEQETAARLGADEAIVLTSTFDVDGSGGDGSLNPDSTYEGWTWILARSAGGAWRHVDHGYG